jgi:hypothetical protein
MVQLYRDVFTVVAVAVVGIALIEIVCCDDDMFTGGGGDNSNHGMSSEVKPLRPVQERPHGPSLRGIQSSAQYNQNCLFRESTTDDDTDDKDGGGNNNNQRLHR